MRFRLDSSFNLDHFFNSDDIVELFGPNLPKYEDYCLRGQICRIYFDVAEESFRNVYYMYFLALCNRNSLADDKYITNKEFGRIHCLSRDEYEVSFIDAMKKKVSRIFRKVIYQDNYNGVEIDPDPRVFLKKLLSISSIPLEVELDLKNINDEQIIKKAIENDSGFILLDFDLLFIKQINVSKQLFFDFFVEDFKRPFRVLAHYFHELKKEKLTTFKRLKLSSTTNLKKYYKFQIYSEDIEKESMELNFELEGIKKAFFLFLKHQTPEDVENVFKFLFTLGKIAYKYLLTARIAGYDLNKLNECNCFKNSDSLFQQFLGSLYNDLVLKLVEDKEVIQCQFCGIVLKYKTQWRQKKYCSPQCRKKAQNRRNYQNHRPQIIRNAIELRKYYKNY